MTDPSAHSLDPPIADSPHIVLVCSSLPLSEPRVSGCKHNFVHLPFKRLSTSPAISSWQRKTLLLFTATCFRCSFPSSVALGWGAKLGVLPHISQWEPLWLLNYPSGTSAVACASPARSLLPLHFLSALLWYCGFFHKSLVIRLLSS